MISDTLSEILVPLDGSTDAERAVPVAARLAAAHGGRLHLVAVFKPVAVGPELGNLDASLCAADLDDITRNTLTEHLERCAEDVELLYNVDARWEMLEGEPSVAEQLADYTRSHDIELVVMRSHRRSTFGRLCLGSVGVGLLDGTDTPCLLLDQRVEDLAGESRRTGFRRIVVPLDGSAAAECALPAATALATGGDAELILLAVVPARWHMRTTAPFAPQGTSALAAASTYLHRVVRRLASTGVKARPLAVSDSSAAEAIVRTVTTEQADLVAIAAPRRSEGDRLFFGSVIDTVLHATDVPILARRVDAAKVEGAARVEGRVRATITLKDLHRALPGPMVF